MALIPTSRLLFFAGALLLPLAVAVTYIPGTAVLCLAVIALFIVIATGDAVASRRRLKTVTLTFPEVVRLTRGKPSNIEITIHHTGVVARLRLGLAWPLHLYSEETIKRIMLPPESAAVSIAWPCTALKQGRYNLDTCYLEICSPLGFWDRRSVVDICSEIRAYPDLISERRDLPGLFMAKQAGIHAQRQLGRGRDFEQLREYTSGDNYEDIDWKATARRGYPVTKLYQVERTQDVYVIIDTSRLSSRRAENSTAGQADDKVNATTDGGTIFDRYISATLIMGLAAERQGDHFGVITFADQMERFIRAKCGKAHFEACREMLYTLQPKPVAPDFSEVFAFIGTQIRKRSLLIFLTGLDDPLLSETFVRHVNLISRNHIVLVNMMNPANARPIFSSPDVSSPDDLYGALAEHLIWENLWETKKLLRTRGASFSLLDNKNLCPDLVRQYTNVKQRQLL